MLWRFCLLLVCFLLNADQVSAQNLVLNPSFEDANVCNERIQPCSPSAWFNLNRNLVQGFYTSPVFKAATGKRYLLFPIGGTNHVTKVCWQTFLAAPLKKDQLYKASFKINTARKIESVSDIGFYFTDAFIFRKKDSTIRPERFLDFSDAMVTRLKSNWYLVEKEFRADSAQQFLVVGNFSGKGTIVGDKDKKDRSIQFAIDDVSIIPLQPTEISNNIRDSVYAITSRHDPVFKDPPPVNPLIDPRLKEKIEVEYEPDTLKIKEILFDFDRYDIKNPTVLDNYRNKLSNDFIKKIVVIGYADKTGSDKYNLDLSLKRAEQIATYISEKFGITVSKIESVGRGKLTAFKDDDRNRRVEIILYY